MKYFLYASIAVWMIGGCSSAPQLPDTADFEAGYSDGCTTAKGDYLKDSDRFRHNQDYHDGWFKGRRECNPSFHRE
jgi:hypothetical protein